LPKIPAPDVQAAQVAPGYRAEVILTDLTYPTSVEFDDQGTTYVAESGYIYGDDIAPARIIRLLSNGATETVADNLEAPVTDLLWHGGRLYVSHRGKISVVESDGVRDLVTGLPSLGDHHNNQLAVGPDGMLYVGQGTATNSGVVGLDNFKMGWLGRYPEVHDLSPKDIRLSDQAFETPDPLTLLAAHPRASGHGSHGHGEQGAKSDDQPQAKEHEGLGERSSATPHDHAQHGAPAKPTTHTEHAAHQATGADAKKDEGHEAHGQKPEKGQEHSGHDKKSHEQDGEHEGHRMVKTFAFQPFGKTPPDDGAARSTIKANGTILRMKPDGSNLEVFAWGLRNPFGLAWSDDGKLYASDNGYDERGGRPIAHAPDLLWEIKQDAWYGFPDYAGGVPVTEAQFWPENGPVPKFLMRDHPATEKPVVTLTHHVAAAKLVVSRNEAFGFPGQLFLALAGDMNPITGAHEERSGFEVVRYAPGTSHVETFFKAKQSKLGPKGMEYVATAGPRRPVDVQFSADGTALYVVDVGAMAIIETATGPVPRPFPRTGVVWRIVRE
jgi:glucose/arabinose dehydrogenase